jgi:hypothetical protein
MLKLVHSIEAVRNRITFTYRGYVLELTPVCSGWQVTVYPRRAELPILSRTDFVARDKERAMDQARKRVDWATQPHRSEEAKPLLLPTLSTASTP